MHKYIYLALVLFLVGCSIKTPENSCVQIADATLRGFLGQEVAAEQVSRLISQSYQLPIESIAVHSYKETIIFDWEQHGIIYSLHAERGTIQDATISYGEDAPSVAQVIACLGLPSRYSAYYTREISEGEFLGVSLLFSEKGILAIGRKYPGVLDKRPHP